MICIHGKLISQYDNKVHLSIMDVLNVNSNNLKKKKTGGNNSITQVVMFNLLQTSQNLTSNNALLTIPVTSFVVLKFT